MIIVCLEYINLFVLKNEDFDQSSHILDVFVINYKDWIHCFDLFLKIFNQKLIMKI